MYCPNFECSIGHYYFSSAVDQTSSLAAFLVPQFLTVIFSESVITKYKARENLKLENVFEVQKNFLLNTTLCDKMKGNFLSDCLLVYNEKKIVEKLGLKAKEKYINIVLEKLATCYVTLFHEKNTDSVL
jgi:hypothetical protein